MTATTVANVRVADVRKEVTEMNYDSIGEGEGWF